MKKKGLLFKRVLIILAGIFVLAFAGVLILDKIVRNKVIQKLEQLEPGVHISYSSLQTSLLRSTLSIDDLQVQYHPSQKGSHQHEIKIQHVLITGINFLKAASAKNLAVNTIELDSTECKLDQVLLDSSKSDTSLKMPFEKITAKHFELYRGHISLIEKEKEQANLDGNITLNNAEFGEQIKFETIDGSFKNIFYRIPQAFHSLHIKEVSINNNKLKLENLSVVPYFNKIDFGKKLGRQADHIRAYVAAITIDKPDLSKLTDSQFIAEKISVTGFNANIFRDRRLKRKLDKQDLPIAFLKSIPYDIHVSKCLVSNASVVYEEYPAEGDETGTLKIEHLNTTLTPLINHPGKGDPDHLTMYVKGSIMGSGSVEGSIYMPLHAKGNYRIDGAIKNLNLPALNSSAENLGLFHIQSGMLDMLAFDFTMNETKAEGKIVGEYHNLIIQKLEFNKKGEKNVAHVRSFVMRHVIVPLNKDKSLPEKKRTGKVDFIRDPTRFVSNYLLQALLTGIKSSFTFGFLIPK